MVDREELVSYITNHHPCEKNMCPSSGMCKDCAKELLREYENEIITSFENSIITKIKKWYWDADTQALVNDPCVVDALINLFIRTVHDTANAIK